MHQNMWNASSSAKAEQKYYDTIYQKYYGSPSKNKYVLPYRWMPKFIQATDASARTLAVYNRQ